jgi:hypothetical protein
LRRQAATAAVDRVEATAVGKGRPQVGRLEEAVLARSRAELRVAAAVRREREAGRSWAEIGRALGVTRQSAWERYGRL